MKKKLKAPKAVRAQFSDWCAPRRGNANPENQTNEVWTWLVGTRACPHAAHEAAGNGNKVSPGWCFSRYGQTETYLPDGSVVYIGGEHEDHYDPDFYIYNDVIVVRPDKSVDIYGYSPNIFPPTDSHSATLVDDTIYIIGCLGYPKDRNHSDTPVYRLKLSDFSIHQVTTHGESPNWLFKHSAKLIDDERYIVCTGGEVTHHPTEMVAENLTTWQFDLKTHSWTAIETKPFTRWLLVREDGHPNDLWEIEQVVHYSRSSRRSDLAEEYRVEFEARGLTVDADLFNARFRPPIPHTAVEPDLDDDNFRTHRILVDDVIVRYVQDSYEIAVTVEGRLSADTIETLKRHGIETFTKLEGVPYELVPI